MLLCLLTFSLLDFMPFILSFMFLVILSQVSYPVFSSSVSSWGASMLGVCVRSGRGDVAVGISRAWGTGDLRTWCGDPLSFWVEVVSWRHSLWP